MNVGEIVYRILGDDTQFNSVMGKVGATASKALSAISKAALAVTGAAAAAVGALAKSAIDGYAEYEQLVGGVETLFEDSADVIKGYADEAYKTAGMSANAYMETVTGFSASLLQGLGGDTAKAAEIANQAVIDMSDNANKMGTDMSLIQNAYQGFAKQNYTMLDNLKLGYGGTQAEMARLINDSGVLGDAMTVTAETVNSVSFDKIIEAIHVVQTEMGISGISAEEAAEAVANGTMTEEEAFEAMGTTAKEASTTIQGSITSMKGAWENFMVGLADPTQDFDRLVSNLVDSVITVSENLMPRIMAVLPQMAVGITELAENLLPLIPETLEKMLPGVLEGANNLISALLDTLSSIADTAIPIIADTADDIISTLITGLVEAVPNLAAEAAELCVALVYAVRDNSEIITQGAIDIVVSLAEAISDNLDELIPAAVDAVIKIAETLLDPENIDRLITAAEDIIKALAKGLADSLPLLVAEAPKIVSELVNAVCELVDMMNEVGVTFCSAVADEIVHHDWASTAETMLTNLADALDNAQKNVMLGIDNLLGGNVYGGDINNVSSVTGIMGAASMRDGIDDTVQMIEDGQKSVAEAYDKGMQEINELYGNSVEDKTGEEWLKAEAEREANARAILAREKKRAEEWKQAQIDAGNEIASGNEEKADSISQSALLTGDALKNAVTQIDNAYDLGRYSSEKAYWSDRLALLEANRNEEDQAWIKYYSQTKEHYEKAVENEAKEAQKAVKEQENALKNSIEDKFRDLETEQIKKEYDDSWLLEQKRAVIETLDHNTDLYKDNDLKLLKEQKSYDDKALKETETAAKKQQDALEKSFDSIVKSRDSLASSLSQKGDIFQSSEETDKWTGAKKKSRSIDIEGFEKKIEAKKKLTSKIAELIEKNTPEDIISELLKMDPEDALAYVNDLLRSPDKLKRLSKGFENDEAYSKIIANMVTENSDEFKSLGEEAGTVFGEGFMTAFRENWEGAFQSVFGDEEYQAQASVQVKSANSSAAETTAVRRDYTAADNSGAGKTAKASGTASQGTYKIVDLNGRYIATVVNAENARTAKTGGG
ncbi:MAG: hypothetical protein J5997_13615 [Oscillospiraceae bacterium]|nr:hypothetical protein [Oscillospiraceae bacterium]